jgi:hypothetical protein
VDAEHHGPQVLDDAQRHLAPGEQRVGDPACDLEVGVEVAAQAELDVAGREQGQVHRLQLAEGLPVLRVLLQRGLLGVGGEDALE